MSPKAKKPAATDQMAACPVTDRLLAAWTTMADAEAPYPELGRINWVMIVRSLIAEIHRLKGACKHE